MTSTPIITALLLTVVLLANAQSTDYNEQVAQANLFANDAQNPIDGIVALRRVEAIIPKVTDSLQGQFFLGLGIAYGQLGNRDSSFYFLDKCEGKARGIKDDLMIIRSLNTRALVLMGNADYDESLATYQRALAIAEGSDEPEYILATCKILGNSAGIFYQLKDYESALDNTNKALKLNKQLENESGLAYNYLRLAIIYKDLDSLNLSVENLAFANQFLGQIQDTITLLYSKNTLGGVYQKKGDYKNALREFKESEKLATKVNNVEEIIYTKASIADILIEMNQFLAAEKYVKEVLNLAQANDFANYMRRGYDLQYQIALAQGQYKAALKYRNNYFMISDSLSSADVQKRIAELQTQYESERKEAEIERLKLEKQLVEANLSSSRNAQAGIAGVGILAIALIIVYFIQKAKKEQAERIVQELQIEGLQKRIMELISNQKEYNISLDYNGLNTKLHNDLTEREFEILRLSLENKTNTEISEELFISVSTVKFHLRNTYAKLGVNNRKEAFEYVVKKA
ncbi:MAG: tetratricopeptide repeat protein [Marinoscillum sp.]